MCMHFFKIVFLKKAFLNCLLFSNVILSFDVTFSFSLYSGSYFPSNFEVQFSEKINESYREL